MACKHLGRSYLGDCEECAAERERARIVAAIRKDVSDRRAELQTAVTDGRLSAHHGEGECQHRVISTLSAWADKIQKGCPDGE